MKIFRVGAVILVTALLTGNALADQRSYVWTYEYMTVPPGDAEVETYYTITSPDKNNLEGNVTAEHRFELEVGMTDRFDFAIYQIFEQRPGENLRYKRFQLRGRYRLSEKGKSIVDPLLYLEYKAVPDFSKQGLEAKLILAKTVGKFNISANPILEFEFEDGENEVEAAYAVGASYGRELFRVGLEAKGSESGHYVGPTIAHGGHFWVAVGTLFNIGSVDDGKAEFQARLLLGVGL